MIGEEEEEEEEEEGGENVFLGMATYKKEKVKMESILRVCTEILGNTKLSLNSFYWDLKRTLADIDCKVELCITDTDSVLYKVTKVTCNGSNRLEKEVMEKLFLAASIVQQQFSPRFRAIRYQSKKELLRFGFVVDPPRIDSY